MAGCWEHIPVDAPGMEPSMVQSPPRRWGWITCPWQRWILKKGITMVHVHIPVQKGALSLRICQGHISELRSNSQKAESSAPPCQVWSCCWVSIREKCGHTNTPMPAWLALLTALTSANWFIWLPSPVGRSVQLSQEYLPGWDEASLPSGPDSIPLCNWFLKNLIFQGAYSSDSQAYTHLLWICCGQQSWDLGNCFRSVQKHTGESLCSAATSQPVNKCL